MSDDLPLISAEPRGEALVVTVHAASFDSASADAIESAIETAAAASPETAVAVDVAEVELLTSAGLGVLVHLHTTLRASNRRFSVCGARGDPADAMRLAGLDRLLEVCRSVGEFLLRLRSAAGG